MAQRRMAVIGGGAWGTALAIHVARLGAPVRLWVWEKEVAERIRERRDNPLYLPGVPIPEAVEPTPQLERAAEGADLLIGAVPTKHARAVYGKLSGALDAAVPVVSTTKGIEQDTLAFPLDVIAETLGTDRPRAVLSGPTFAREVARGGRAAVVVASEDAALASRVQEALSSAALRLYTNTDPTGVQLAGALKNVIAIAAGVVQGLEMGHNGLAALVTRGLAELSRLGLAMGGRASTFSGLAGLGDLVLTCTGRLSRNRDLGVRLAGGQRLQDILATTRAVVEGVGTTRSARTLARRAGVEMPIVEEVHRILYEDGSPHDAVERLMSRPLTAEDDES